MNTRTLLIGAALFGSTAMMAQSSRVSAGLELALPLGTYGNSSGIGFGATLGYEIPVGDHLGLMAQAGYILFTGKDYTTLGITIKGPSSGTIPIQVGAKWYFSEQQKGFYVAALIGVHMASVTTPAITFNGTVISPETSKLNTYFSYAPLMGYMVTDNIDLALRYQIELATTTVTVGTVSATSTVGYGYLGLRAAYMFGGGGGGGHHHHH